jgi:hypothetical protein
VNVRSLCPLAAALGVWVGGFAQAGETKPAAKPAAKTTKAETKASTPAPMTNQKLADAIAERIMMTGVCEGCDVKVDTDAGTVTLTGPCADAAHKMAILKEVRVVPGVKLVRDGMTVGSSGIMQVGAQGTPQALPVGPVAALPMAAYPPGPNGPVGEPMPLGVPGTGPAAGFAPPLPPNAWPTYAPYNNASRIGYPTAYPYNAFPFIGPFYPFPKVPLGWRSVNLTWEDAHWWYGRTSAPHDYWRVRFW